MNAPPAPTPRVFITSDKGAVKPILANAITALELSPEWQEVLGFNEFIGATVALRPPPWMGTSPEWQPTAWVDRDDLLIAEWLQHQQVCVGAELAAQAVQVVAGRNSFHPVRDYLDGLDWDGTPRLDNWLVTYLGAVTNPYVRAVGRRFLISAVARIYEPGCKADCALILEGPQGTLKSTALKVLSDPWFTDEIADFGSKDAAEQTVGTWFIEVAEMGALRLAEVTKIKAFMSRAVDRFRPAYGRRVVEHKRQLVFAGTVNGDDYLRDETGGRRFWPVPVGVIDIDRLSDARDQIWAEASEAYRAGEPWWLETDALRGLAEEQQRQRFMGDPWFDLVRARIENTNREGEPLGGSPPSSVSVSEILEHVIGLKPGAWKQKDQNRVAAILKDLKWKRYQKRIPGSARRPWRYQPKAAAQHESGDSGD